ncbi:Hypothetical predicted protein [Octopus vulgaris]|uniref:Uncharacterized protein n=2 Tax=Octopus TaxID=6643 RepID=A0AA36F6J9_OCTVU|nr:uncharacterized protein LOC115214158 [Octopus sinensis]CAI9726322.1 Hypothetical predicted protein [Octopus vulgaris]
MKTLIGIIVLLTVCYIPLVSCTCNDETVSNANSSCASILDDMGEEERKGAGSFPIVCAYFNDYLKCMNLLISECDKKHLLNFKSFKEFYTRPPYRCRITPTYKGSQQHIAASGWILLFGLAYILLLQIA